MKWIINNYKDNFVEESYLNKLSKKNYKNIKLEKGKVYGFAKN